MKLKEAKVLAIIKGLNYVAADRDGAVYAYQDEPEIFSFGWYAGGGVLYDYLGEYSGKKSWRKTLREVK